MAFLFRYFYSMWKGDPRPRIGVTFRHPDAPAGNMHLMTGDKIELHGSGWSYLIGGKTEWWAVAPGWYEVTETEVVKL